jgi:hypothetical protein
MQYKIPQEIGNEDRLIGPLSLRQLIIVGIGGGIAYMIYISLAKTTDPIVYIPPMVIIILLTLAIAFFKKDNLTFTRMALLFLEMAINPTKRVWVNFAGDISPFKLIEVFSQADIEKMKKKEAADAKTIDDIDKLVQILDYDPNDVIQREQQKLVEQRMKEEENPRAGLLEQLASQAAKSAAVGIKKNIDPPAETSDLYIKQPSEKP